MQEISTDWANAVPGLIGMERQARKNQFLKLNISIFLFQVK
jgi:hypothetical protein